MNKLKAYKTIKKEKRKAKVDSRDVHFITATMTIYS